MKELLKKFKNHSLEEAIKIEEADRQFLALKNLFNNINNKEIYLSLILANSIICYQLSSTWENYWKEFSKYFLTKWIICSPQWVIKELSEFIKQSKWNKRFIETKIKRLEKIKPFLKEFIWNEEFYYTNMQILQEKLSIAMNQKKEAKTIVFAVKMFSYWARNYFWKLIYFPFEINIPIDSRLTHIYEKYNEDKNLKIEDFYMNLSKELKIPELHLDAIIWCNYKDLIKDED